ncbi:MAG: UvrD-helicase domain-containing protein [Clostridia bacterium]|nr:UvrD-helicase domain-containing protein [Clostridia bacterium]
MDLSGLNEQQREAVQTTEGPLLVLAGAGSGKTRVLTHRIAYLMETLGVSGYNILALTFTNKAAGEMKSRVENLVGAGASAMWVMTFHAMCARILRMDIDKLGYGKSFVIYDDQDQQTLWKRIIKERNLNDKVFTPRMLSSKVSNAKNHSDQPYEFLRQTREPIQVLDAYHAYQQHLKKNNALDFDDLLLLTLELFRNFPEVLEKYQNRFRYILVDEYQDTNLAQYHITRLLAARHKNLCVVGDDDQSIYGWRGADIRNILEFERDFPGTKTIRLEQNYRSTEIILNAANRIIANNRSRKEKKLWTSREGGENIGCYAAQDERDEASHIANKILSLARYGERRYDDFAILYRTNAQSRVLEMYLKSYDIPYRVYGGPSFFQRAEVKDILAYLHILANPADDVAFLRVVNVPKRGIGQTSIDALAAQADRLGVSLFTEAMTGEGLPDKLTHKFHAFTDTVANIYGELVNRPLSEAVELLLDAIHYDAYLQEEKKENYEARAEVVAEFIGYIREFEQGLDPDTTDILSAFLENVALFSQTDLIDEENGTVSLMTLHSAKGLEFPVVFLAGLEEGLFPSAQSKLEPDKLEEERRLMYVGITRAKDELYLSHAAQRMLFDRTEFALPSTFLRELSDLLPEEARPKAPEPIRTSWAFTPNFHSLEPTKKPAPVPRVAVAPTPKGEALTVAPGCRVKHASFGEGTVLCLTGSGNSQIVEIDFDSGITKKFASAYAPIEVLNQ